MRHHGLTITCKTYLAPNIEIYVLSACYVNNTFASHQQKDQSLEKYLIAVQNPERVLKNYALQNHPCKLIIQILRVSGIICLLFSRVAKFGNMGQ